jgi:hypothetical protein
MALSRYLPGEATSGEHRIYKFLTKKKKNNLKNFTSRKWYRKFKGHDLYKLAKQLKISTNGNVEAFLAA